MLWRGAAASLSRRTSSGKHSTFPDVAPATSRTTTRLPLVFAQACALSARVSVPVVSIATHRYKSDTCEGFFSHLPIKSKRCIGPRPPSSGWSRLQQLHESQKRASVTLVVTHVVTKVICFCGGYENYFRNSGEQPLKCYFP